MGGRAGQGKGLGRSQRQKETRRIVEKDAFSRVESPMRARAREVEGRRSTAGCYYGVSTT